jgi:hypothetical protein
MSYTFHPREQHYPTKGFEIEIKGRKFLINSHGGYRGQLDQVKHLMRENGVDDSAAIQMCFANWCAARPDLCQGKTVKSPKPKTGIAAGIQRAVDAVRSAVTPSNKRRNRRGCSSCGGGGTV